MSYLKADEYHLYGSSRIGVYAPELYVAFYTDEDSLVQPLYGYNPYAYHGDPCGCDTTSTCSNPPCDPCWCYDNDPCGCPACETCEDCYCSDWPVEDYPDVLYFTPQSRAFIRGRKRGACPEPVEGSSAQALAMCSVSFLTGSFRFLRTVPPSKAGIPIGACPEPVEGGLA